MDGKRAANEPNGCRTHAEFLQRRTRRRDDSRMVGKALVVVGAHQQDFADALHLHMGLRRRFKVVQSLVIADFPRFLKIAFQAFENRVGHAATFVKSRRTLPQFPAAIRSNPVA